MAALTNEEIALTRLWDLCRIIQEDMVLQRLPRRIVTAILLSEHHLERLEVQLKEARRKRTENFKRVLDELVYKGAIE